MDVKRYLKVELVAKMHQRYPTYSELMSDREERRQELPQEITESFGTGVHDDPETNTGQGEAMPEGLAGYTVTTPGLTAADEDALWHQVDSSDEADADVAASPELTGGDIDAAWETAADEGDEAVGGTVATPDQDVTEEIEAAVGLEMDDRSFLRTQDILEDRDDRRWELDPTSSEDYQERRD